MSRKQPQELVVEFANEPPATPTPEQVDYFTRRMVELHAARMQATGAVAQGLSSAEGAAGKQARGSKRESEDAGGLDVITAERDAAPEELRRLRMGRRNGARKGG